MQYWLIKPHPNNTASSDHIFKETSDCKLRLKTYEAKVLKNNSKLVIL